MVDVKLDSMAGNNGSCCGTDIFDAYLRLRFPKVSSINPRCYAGWTTMLNVLLVYTPTAKCMGPLLCI
eukprot:jgi/Botrbrau1/18961/Bobra.0871s0001.1